MRIRRNAKILIASVYVLLLCQSCGGDPLVGDWSVCKDSACSQLQQDGLRFYEDGNWSLLITPDESVDVNKYLREVKMGSYTHEGDRLTVTVDKKILEGLWCADMTARTAFEGDDLVLTMTGCDKALVPGGKHMVTGPVSSTLRLRRVQANAIPFEVPEDPQK